MPDPLTEFAGRIMMLVEKESSVIAGHYHKRDFFAAGLHITETIRTPELTVIPRVRPITGDNYQLAVYEGDGTRENLIFQNKRIPATVGSKTFVDPAFHDYIQGLRLLTVLDKARFQLTDQNQLR